MVLAAEWSTSGPTTGAVSISVSTRDGSGRETNAFFPGWQSGRCTIVGVAGSGVRRRTMTPPWPVARSGCSTNSVSSCSASREAYSSAYQDNPGVDLCPRQTIALFNCTARFDDVLTVGGRLGWAMGKWMPYVTGGYASARFTEQANNKSLAPMATNIVSWAQERAQGWYIGGGAECGAVAWMGRWASNTATTTSTATLDWRMGLSAAWRAVPLPNDNVVLNHRRRYHRLARELEAGPPRAGAAEVTAGEKKAAPPLPGERWRSAFLGPGAVGLTGTVSSRSTGHRRQAVVEHDHVALHHAGAEGDALAVGPHLRADGLAGEHRRREAHLQALEPRRVAAAAGLDDGAAGHAVGAQPVQDRRLEAAGGRGLGVGVQRVAVAGEAIDQRRVRVAS